MLFLDYLAFFIVIWLLMGALTPAGGISVTVVILVIWAFWPQRRPRTEIVYVHPGRTFLA